MQLSCYNFKKFRKEQIAIAFEENITPFIAKTMR